MDKISLIIPCYNEQETIPLFYDKITRIAKEIPADFEFLFINDGSADKTLAYLKAMAQTDSRVQYISFSRNFGKEAAICAGLRNITGDFAAVMDVDLQDPPVLLKKMYEILCDDPTCDCVATRLATRTGEPVIRSFFARTFYKLMNKISQVHMEDGERDFRMMRRKMADTVANMNEYNRFSKGLFDWVGFHTRWLKYSNIERAAGTTKWKFFPLVRYAFEGIIGFSVTPLLLPYFFSGLSAVTVLGLLIAIIIRAALHAPISTALTISLLLFIVTAVLTLCIGIACSYISRIYSETKRRPQYIIAEQSQFDQPVSFTLPTQDEYENAQL